MSGLPAGFDPNRMTFNSQPVIEIRRNESIPNFSSYTRHLSLWDRFDNCIISIGNWFAEYSEAITGVFCIILGLCMAIPFIGWLISLGWLWGIVAGIFLGGIAYYAAMIVIGIFAIISNIALATIRYIFYNGWTFLLAIAIIAGLYLYKGCSSNSKPIETPKTEIAAPQTTQYRCIAYHLNVRSTPSVNGYVLGTLKRNEAVDVYDISNGFARILYNGQDGYVSTKYLTRY